MLLVLLCGLVYFFHWQYRRENDHVVLLRVPVFYNRDMHALLSSSSSQKKEDGEWIWLLRGNCDSRVYLRFYHGIPSQYLLTFEHSSSCIWLWCIYLHLFRSRVFEDDIDNCWGCSCDWSRLQGGWAEYDYLLVIGYSYQRLSLLSCLVFRGK